MISPVILPCPSCSTSLSFSHEDTTILQCVCGSAIQRKEGDVLLSKPFYLVQRSFDTLKPGTTGTWDGKNFRILGRVRTWLEESVFNYWTILLDNGELAWLAEGYGMYAIMKKTAIDQHLTAGYLVNLKTGVRKDLLKGESFLLEKKLHCRRWEVEGEVWLPECQATFSIYEFAGDSGRYVTLFQFLTNYIIPYEVVNVSYASLNLDNTRPDDLPGYNFTCTKCESPILVKTYPYAQSCACRNCGLQYTLQEEGYKKTGNYPSLDTGPDIVIGSHGKVKGIDYELIGYALKEEANKHKARWKEYTLYNRQEGYAFLSEYAGHWIYLREQGKAPVLKTKTVRHLVYEGEDFQLYNAYGFKVLNARGEFPINIFNSEGTQAKEFISPPEIWIQEQNRRTSIIWFHGEHVWGGELKKEFDFPAGLPYKEGIGAVEPRFFISPYKLVRMAAIGLAFLLLLNLVVASTKQNRVVLDQTYSFMGNDSLTSITMVSPPLHLDKWRSNLKFYIYAPVDNDWFELNATLVNQSTGTEYGLEKGVEYYHGYSDGERWSEGSNNEDAYLTQVPEGDYVLQLQGVRSTGYGHVQDFHVTVTYDTMMESNFWLSVLALLIWPVVQYIRTHNNEKKRWYNSPYSPFSYED